MSKCLFTGFTFSTAQVFSQKSSVEDRPIAEIYGKTVINLQGFNKVGSRQNEFPILSPAKDLTARFWDIKSFHLLSSVFQHASLNLLMSVLV